MVQQYAWSCRGFYARAPVTHVQGDLIVKDVCETCNNRTLAGLDGYGKELFDRYFHAPVYEGEAVAFEYDGDRLLRWLLKLSYNSARAQNADARVLRDFRAIVMGRSPFNNRIRCWLHLVTASCFDAASQSIRCAQRKEQGQSNVEEPRWFRIGQFRIPSYPALQLVQRAVVINSYAFTLLIAPPELPWPCEEFDHWAALFATGYPFAKLILPSSGRLQVTGCGDHAAASIYPLLHHYPTRFAESQNPLIVQSLKGDLKVVFLSIPRELIESGDIDPIASAFRDMISTREKALAFRQRVAAMVEGFDDDPRPLWQIPEVQQFFRQLFIACPFAMLLAYPEGGLLKLLAACWLYEAALNEEVQRKRTADFLQRAFRGLNEVTHMLALSEEVNRHVCETATACLIDDSVSDGR